MNDKIVRSNQGSTEILAPAPAGAPRKRWAAPKVIISELAFTAGGSKKLPEGGTPPIRGTKPTPS
jgi:hypothetical protein